jgi:hypothetical protein
VPQRPFVLVAFTGDFTSSSAIGRSDAGAGHSLFGHLPDSPSKVWFVRMQTRDYRPALAANDVH